MEIEHSETIRPLVEAPYFESSDSPPLFIAYMREVGGVMLNYLTPSRPDAEPLRITTSGTEMTVDELKTLGAVDMATIETIRAVGREILNRNINTLYYERLLMSKKKRPVVDEMQDKTKAYQQDKLEYIKSPVVLEFLGLPEDTSLAESKLETAIINNLEKFLMEMGKGYALVARQQHIRTEENDYYIDLVFYNYLIKSFILVDLKVNRITYQDVGQMDMYLQMYDKMKKGPDDNPTIGIILCTETDSDVARYSTLAKNDQMFAAKYKLYLPDKEDLRREIERQKELYLMAHPEENDKE